jgi:hypothetical protein
MGSVDLQGLVLTDEELGEINVAGRERGCYRCGVKEPGTVSGNFVPEFHPPRIHGATSVIIPTCLSCSRSTGTLVTMAQHRRI